MSETINPNMWFISKYCSSYYSDLEALNDIEKLGYEPKFIERQDGNLVIYSRKKEI